MSTNMPTHSYIVLDGVSSITIPKNSNVVMYESDCINNAQVTITIAEYASVEYVLQKNIQEVSTRTITFILLGVHARVVCKGTLLLKNQQRYDLTINQCHESAYTTSSIEIKMVLDNASQASYAGKICIKEKATKSIASQIHKALVVSTAASVRSEPNLEVLTHDVVCNHGSAISYITPDHLHYLMSRGILHNKAEELIIAGFLQD